MIKVIFISLYKNSIKSLEILFVSATKTATFNYRLSLSQIQTKL